MKKKEVYMCDFCGASYESEARCLDCESLHAKTTGSNTVARGYRHGKRFPKLVEVCFVAPNNEGIPCEFRNTYVDINSCKILED